MPNQGEQCPFCHFIKNQPDEIWEVEETENFYAWLEYPEPRAKGQMNVVPKNHLESIMEFSPEEWNEAMMLLREVMGKVIQGLGAEGISVTMNVKEAAGQMVPHAYIQVWPRFQDEENSGTPTGAIFPKKEELAGKDDEFREIQESLQGAEVNFEVEKVEPHPESQKFKEDENTEKDGKKEANPDGETPNRGNSIEWM